ncbi:MAG: DUF3459 domain-containing protein, partial [Anaerolineae bacterium]|nr:DUF3459 domain-containing protein [Anaerolineae bacterium]
KAVTEGRRSEFKDHQWEGQAPDPQAETTFQQSKLNHHLRNNGIHKQMLAFYTELIRLRKTHPALRQLDKHRMQVIGYERERVILLHRWHDSGHEVMAVFNLNSQPVTLTLPVPVGQWTLLLDSAQGNFPMWKTADASAGLTLAPKSIIVLESERTP